MRALCHRHFSKKGMLCISPSFGGVSPIVTIPIIDEGFHVVAFSVTLFCEVDDLPLGVILPHHDFAIPHLSLHKSVVHQFENGGLPRCLW